MLNIFYLSPTFDFINKFMLKQSWEMSNSVYK